MSIFGLKPKQVKAALDKGNIETTFIQKLGNFLGIEEAKSIPKLQAKLQGAENYKQRASIVAQHLNNTDSRARSGLFLALDGNCHSSINLEFRFKDNSYIISKEFITPANDGNHGFTFDKKKFEILSKGKNNAIKYTDTLPTLSQSQLKDIGLPQKDGLKKNLHDILNDKEQSNSRSAKYDNYRITKDSDLLKVEILNKNQEIEEFISLLDTGDNFKIIDHKAGKFIPNYSLYDSLVYSQHDLQSFLMKDEKVRDFIADNSKESINFRQEFNGASCTVLLKKIDKQGKNLNVRIIPPKSVAGIGTGNYSTRNSFAILTNKILNSRGKNENTDLKLTKYEENILNKYIESEDEYEYKNVAAWILQHRTTSNIPIDELGGLAYDIANVQDELPKKQYIYHLPAGANREYKFGGCEFTYNTDNHKITNLSVEGKKKGSNDDDSSLELLKYNNKTAFLAKHESGYTLEKYLDQNKDKLNNKQKRELAIGILNLFKSLLSEGILFIDPNLGNIVIENGNLKAIDGKELLVTSTASNKVIAVKLLSFKINEIINDDIIKIKDTKNWENSLNEIENLINSLPGS